MKLSEITKVFENFAPLGLQESYDNSGIQVGNPNMEIKGVQLSLDITEAIVDEAIESNHNLIICHHPLLFSGLKSLTGRNEIENIVIKAIKNDIAIYAAHTNMDNVQLGVNKKFAEKLSLINTQILSPAKNNLFKLVTFVPSAQASVVRKAIFKAGAGHIGNYDSCSFNTNGQGSFRGDENTNPFVGKKGELHFEDEIKIETVIPSHLKSIIISALLKAHPYEEVAYDIYPLENSNSTIGAGMVGYLENETDEKLFLLQLKEIFNLSVIKHTAYRNKKIKKVAICGGSGSFLIHKAKAVNADIFITGDIKYHQFFEAENKLIIADIGHYESEKYTTEIFYDILTKNFPNFAVRLSNVISNPINYI